MNENQTKLSYSHKIPMVRLPEESNRAFSKRKAKGAALMRSYFRKNGKYGMDAKVFVEKEPEDGAWVVGVRSSYLTPVLTFQLVAQGNQVGPGLFQYRTSFPNAKARKAFIQSARADCRKAGVPFKYGDLPSDNKTIGDGKPGAVLFFDSLGEMFLGVKEIEQRALRARRAARQQHPAPR